MHFLESPDRKRNEIVVRVIAGGERILPLIQNTDDSKNNALDLDLFIHRFDTDWEKGVRGAVAQHDDVGTMFVIRLVDPAAGLHRQIQYLLVSRSHTLNQRI